MLVGIVRKERPPGCFIRVCFGKSPGQKGGTTIVPKILDGIDQALEALYPEVPRERGPIREEAAAPCFFVDCPTVEAGRKRMGARDYLARCQVTYWAGGAADQVGYQTVAMTLLREMDRLETTAGPVIPQGMIASVGRDKAVLGFEVRYREAPVEQDAPLMERETTKGAIR